MKGYGVYKSLLLEKDNMKKQYEFTFIGNLPKDGNQILEFLNHFMACPGQELNLMIFT